MIALSNQKDLLVRVMYDLSESVEVYEDVKSGRYVEHAEGLSLEGRSYRLRCDGSDVVLEERRHVGWFWLCEFSTENGVVRVG